MMPDFSYPPRKSGEKGSHSQHGLRLAVERTTDREMVRSAPSHSPISP